MAHTAAATGPYFVSFGPDKSTCSILTVTLRKVLASLDRNYSFDFRIAPN